MGPVCLTGTANPHLWIATFRLAYLRGTIAYWFSTGIGKRDHEVWSARLCSQVSRALNASTARMARPAMNHQGDRPVAVTRVSLPRSAKRKTWSVAQGYTSA